MATLPITDAASKPEGEQKSETSHPQGLSKNAQKRAAKAARLHELKLERRAREKEVKKRKRRERAEAIANGDSTLAQKRPKINAAGEVKVFNARVVIDLGFDDLMSDKEVNSLTSQLAYTYSANRRAAHSFSSLLFTSLYGRTKERLDAMNEAGYRRWSRTEWWEEGYDRLWTDLEASPSDQSSTKKINLQHDPQSAADGIRSTAVYLTADSEEELLELKEGETYIIGGICDHNRYKNLCLDKAINSSIRHARLPIGRYIALATRKVLTVNQVFEILLKWADTRSWEEAFWAVIPRRKFRGGDRGEGGGDDCADEDDENADQPREHDNSDDHNVEIIKLEDAEGGGEDEDKEVVGEIR
ncbi:hypothetical protein BDN67DRAFT_925683 [Paxillus ammoniavirescens]|nr:hypothetical protein BDN67DRAFT_925683 [Paxillus ammoniavirescens]